MNATLFLATTHHGVTRALRHLDSTWSVEDTLLGQDVRCLAADPRNADVVYAGTQGNGILRSLDRGQTWGKAGLEGRVVKAISVSSVDSDTIFAGTKPALMFVSRDGGANWTELSAFRKIPSRRFWFSPAEAPYIAYVQSIALSPTDPDVILVGIEFGAVVRSDDGGKTWSNHRRRALRDCHKILFHQRDGDWAYEAGGTGAGAALSTDGGRTWSQPKAGLDPNYGWACAAHPDEPEIWYVSVSPSPSKAHSSENAAAYICRSNSSGGWVKLSGGLPQPLNHMPYALLTDPSAPDHVYAGLSNGDIWHSVDRGDTWQKLPFNLKRIHRALIML